MKTYMKYGVFLLMFLVTVQFAFSQANAGPDKAICSGTGVEIGAMNNDPDLCYSWSAVPTDPSIVNLKTPKITVNPATTTTYTLTVVGQDFSSRSIDNVKVFVVSDLKIKEVSFSANAIIAKDDGSGYYVAPHWKDNQATAFPVCYKAGDLMKISAKIEINEDIGIGIPLKIRGNGTDDYNVPASSVSSTGNMISLPATNFSKVFPSSKVDFFEQFKIEWEVSFDEGNTWCVAGESKNPVYVTLSQPVGNVTLFYTTVHLGCKNAKGQTNENGVFTSVWSEFIDRDVRRVDGTRLTYYNNWTNVNVYTSELLKYGDGQCGSWAKLLLDILKIQGIDNFNEYVIVTYNNGSGFFVKNWTFSDPGTSGDAIFPYLNIPDDPLTLSNSYDWIFSEVNDIVGVPGEGTSNPASLFNNHQFITYGGKYYDPSYGVEANSIAEMETMAMDAFYRVEDRFVNEATINYDLNHDGDKNDLVFVRVLIIKKNSATIEWHVDFDNY